jgi:hypothetical protein
MLACEERTAQLQHRCDHCDLPIFPGDRYLRTVTVRANKKYRFIFVTKQHVNPFCPYDDDPAGIRKDDVVETAPGQTTFEFRLAA